MSSLQTFDIAVVGAGPAGSVAAALLASARWRVILLDKAKFPRRKVCGCCLNGLALSSLAAAGLGELPARLGAVPLSRVKLAANGRTATVHLPGGVALSREAMDAELVRHAQACGVEVRTGVKVKLGETIDQPATLGASGTPTSPRWEEVGMGGWTLHAGDDTLRAKVVIDASGLNGQLTSTDTGVSATSRIGAGTVLDSQADYPTGVIHMATGGGGYVGLVRVEDGRLDVAAAFDPAFVRDQGGLAIAAETVVARSGLPSLRDLRHAEWKGTPPLTRTPHAVAGPRWFAVGDATGYVEPFTGEGMAWALAAAVAVVPMASRAVSGWSDRLAQEWTATHRRVIVRRQAICRMTARVLRSPVLCSWVVRGLNWCPALAGPVVQRLNRPFPRVY